MWPYSDKPISFALNVLVPVAIILGAAAWMLWVAYRAGALW